MTTREKAHKLLDELPESEIEPIVEIMALVSRGEGKPSKVAERKNGDVDDFSEDQMAPLPEGWGETLTGEPMPNVVAAVRRSRAGH
jgi:hypothetical protein